MVNEIWVKIDGIKGNYSVSNWGDVINNKTGIILRHVYANGHPSVKFTCNDGKVRQFYIAKLVAQAFCPKASDDDKFVGYKNGDKTDCRADNLFWSSNTNSSKIGTIYHKANRQILAVNRNTGDKAVFNTVDDCSDYTKVSVANIVDILSPSPLTAFNGWSFSFVKVQ